MQQDYYAEQPYYQNNQSGFKNDEFNTDDFQPDNMLRKGFIRKVYGILLGQLFVTLIFIAIGTFWQDLVNNFVRKHLYIMIVAAIIAFVTLILLCCIKSIARSVPTNYILLGIFTVCESYALMFICSEERAEYVFSALAITVACTLGLTAYACFTKNDYSPWYASMWGILFTFIICGILCFSFGNWRLIYCGLGVIIYSIYIVIDTQLIMGKFSVQFSSEDYICAAMNLYLDIINLFLYILSMFGNK